MILQLEKVSKSFGGRLLFADLSFHLEKHDRLALVGSNGAGKTTLLNIIAGVDDADEGSVKRARDVQIGYLTQELNFNHEGTIFEAVLESQKELQELERKMDHLESTLHENSAREDLYSAARLRERFESLGGYTLHSRARGVLFGLGFNEEDLGRSCTEFSGGWQMRIALARLLLSSPDILLLDEPTNHLDLESVRWLEGFLSDYSGAVIVVSHDRVFMDAMVNKVAEISCGKFRIFKGNYTSYQNARKLQRENLLARKSRQDEEIARIEAFINRFRSKATKARQVQERIKKLEKMERIEVEDEHKKISFNFVQPPRCARDVVSIKNLTKRYGDKTVYEGLDFSVYRGEKVALVGPNGAGKSTLLKLIAGVIEPDEGEISYGAQVSKSYYAQHRLEALNPDNTVFKELDDAACGWTISQVRGLLGAFLFSGDDVNKQVKVLSGGEKARLSLAKMLVSPSSLLCLDEPTNHLDIAGVDILEQALLNFEGTMVFITHDRHFINSIANRIVEIKAGTLKSFNGNWQYYLYKSGEGQSDAASAADKPHSFSARDAAKPALRRSHRIDGISQCAPAYKSKEQKRNEAQMRDKLYSALKTRQKRIKQLEAQLECDNRRLSELLEKFADPDFYIHGESTEDALIEHARLKAQIERNEEEWLILSSEIEEETKRIHEKYSL